jgi:hypothetical protein
VCVALTGVSVSMSVSSTNAAMDDASICLTAHVLRQRLTEP